MKEKNILVTGGCGFIFSNFILSMMLKNNSNNRIINLDKLTYAGNINNLRDVEKNKNYKFYKGDICDKLLVEKIVKEEEIKIIINGAAETHVDRAILSADDFVKTDVLGAFNLLEASRKFDVEKYMQISTDEVYGSILNGSFKESDALNPRNPYSASKAAADMIVNSFFITHGVPALITRSSNNYGPFQHPEKFIPKTIIHTILGRKIPVYAKGENIRDWLFVEDNCSAIKFVLDKGKFGETYNIASHNEKRNTDVAKLILSIMNKDESLIEFVKDRPGHDFRYSLDTKKIEELGWKPKIMFEEGLKKTVNWYKENESWWKKLV